MSKMSRAEFQKAMNQVSNFVVSVRLKRCDENISMFYSGDNGSRTRKRNARKIYKHLNFDEDEVSEPSWDSETETRRRRKKLRDTSVEKRVPRPYRRKCKVTSPISCTQTTATKRISCVQTAAVKRKITVKTEKTEPKKNSVAAAAPLVPRLKVKSAAELGSSIIFVDACDPAAPAISNVPSNIAPPETATPTTSDLTESHSSASKLNIQLISKLYKQIFTQENQNRIKTIVEILQFLSDNIDRKNDKLSEINNSRNTDAEKLMLRHQAHNEFNRNRESKQTALKEEFETFNTTFDSENFEILFQFFFLGILKIVIISESNKKGAVFKKLINLLSQSLSSSNYKDERVLNVLKSKNFRNDCLCLIQFIEKYSETDYFEMVFLSESDKLKMLSKKDENRTELPEIGCGSKNESPISHPSVISYSMPSDTVPCGSNLLLQQSEKTETENAKKDEIPTEFVDMVGENINSLHEPPLFRLPVTDNSKQSNAVSCGSNLQPPHSGRRQGVRKVQANPLLPSVNSIIAANENQTGVVDTRSVNQSGNNNESSFVRPCVTSYSKDAIPCRSNLSLQQYGKPSLMSCSTESNSILRRQITKNTTRKTKPTTSVTKRPTNSALLKNNSQNSVTLSAPIREPCASSAANISSAVVDSPTSSSVLNIPASSLNKIHLNNRVLLGQQLLSRFKNSVTTAVTPTTEAQISSPSAKRINMINVPVSNSCESKAAVNVPSTSCASVLVLNSRANKPVSNIPVSNFCGQKSAPSSVSVATSNTRSSIPDSNVPSNSSAKVVKPVTRVPTINNVNIPLSNCSLERPVTNASLVTNVRLPRSNSGLVKPIPDISSTNAWNSRPSLPVTSVPSINTAKIQVSDSRMVKPAASAFLPTNSLGAQSSNSNTETPRVNLQIPKSFLLKHFANVPSNDNKLAVIASPNSPSVKNEEVLTIVGELAALPLSCLQSVNPNCESLSQDLQTQPDKKTYGPAVVSVNKKSLPPAPATYECGTISTKSDPLSAKVPGNANVSTKGCADANSLIFKYVSKNNENVKPKGSDLLKSNRIDECMKYKDSCCTNSTESQLRTLLLDKNSFKNQISTNEFSVTNRINEGLNLVGVEGGGSCRGLTSGG